MSLNCGQNDSPCQTWADHELSGERIVEAGRHPVKGAYQIVEVCCARCGQRRTETQWMPRPAARLFMFADCGGDE